MLTHWQRGNPKSISKKYIMEGISPGRGEIQREKSKDSFLLPVSPFYITLIYDQGHCPTFSTDPDHPQPFILHITLVT